AARRAGVLDGLFRPDLGDVADCDVLVLAMPVDAVADMLAARGPALRRVPVVTDVGSTKAGIVRAAARAGLGRTFVGAHPLAGDHRAGWRASRPGLFRGATVFVTPTARSAPAAVACVSRLWREVGAKPRRATPAWHDRRMAAVSHLPQAGSTALALTLAGAAIPRAALGRGGRDATRLAASSTEVWTAILAENGPQVAAMLARYAVHVDRIRWAIGRGDRGAIRRALTRARAWATD
ncbi:MAG: prephenate dehydrogenase, partial [Gemmatimonadota bacterium]|nr:prephenate dehydrogenase [Gemmatimonadota bacterium]